MKAPKPLIKSEPAEPELTVSAETLQSLYSLLGNAVLLPFERGEKGPKYKDWDKITFQETQTPEYQKALQNKINMGGNLGASLGIVSNNLVSIDIDQDNWARAFLSLNPHLKPTLVTKGARGVNVWLRIKASTIYPNTQAYYPLKTQAGKKYGEWRCGGGGGAQTVIFGRHPDGMDYQILERCQPAEIDFSEINWPQFVVLPWVGGAQQPAEPASVPKQRKRKGDAGLQEEEGLKEKQAKRQEEHARHVAADIDAYYDCVRKEHPLRDETAIYQSLTETQFKRVLRFRNISSQIIEGRNWSGADIVIRHLQQYRYVNYVGALAGHDCGYYQENGIPILVTSSPKLIEPKKGDWDTLSNLLSGLLWDEDEPYADEQHTVFCGWLQVAYNAFRVRKFQPGQALALAGPIEAGKSLLQSLITEIIGGRSAKAALFLQGRTDFNGELFEAEHLLLEDEAASTVHRDRLALGTSIKNLIANRLHACHPKQRQIVNLCPWWRVSISLNDRDERFTTALTKIEPSGLR